MRSSPHEKSFQRIASALHSANTANRSPRACRGVAASALLFCFLLLIGAVGSPQVSSTHAPLTSIEERKIVHLLNRAAFGPRPGDIERVQAMGVDAWIEEQLRPAAIDDAVCEARLADLPTLSMTVSELVRAFPKPEPRAANQKPDGMQESSAFRVEPMAETAEEMQPGERRERRMNDREHKPAVIVMELAKAKLIRAVHSKRQLQEVMTDFWFNHFNVNAGKEACRWLVTSYERDAIRPNALGRFRDLLGATAKHPAMLFYLDNYQSVKTDTTSRDRRLARRGSSADTPARRNRGLNENYGRELLELHTLGVDGGYTQRDVTEVARCFTGWSIEDPRHNGGSGQFLFRKQAHDEGIKTVLGEKIASGGGLSDGERILDMLARHPKTAAFICEKLVRHFVSDSAPSTLVTRAADVFQKSGGDIAAVLRTILTSPEFQSPSSWRAKIKKPFELAASTLRMTGSQLEASTLLPKALEKMGEPLYQCEPPTGYPSSAKAWVNTGALLNRMNFALAFAGGKIKGVRVSLASSLPSLPEGKTKEPGEVLEMMIHAWLGGDVSSTTRETLSSVISDPDLARARLDDRTRTADMVRLAALVLGSPEFQRR